MRVPSLLLAWLAGAWLGGLAASALFGAAAWPLALACGGLLGAVALARRDFAIACCAVIVPIVFAAAVVRDRLPGDGAPADAIAHRNGGDVTLRGTLRDDPDRGETSQRLAVSVREVSTEAGWEAASGGVLVRIPLLPRYRAGDVVEVTGKLEPPPQLEDFDYAAYLRRRGIASVMEYPRVLRDGHDEPAWPRAITLRARRALSHAIAVSLPEPHASLAQGVVLGQRSALSPEVADQLNTTNTSHLVVVSGSNVVLVSSFCVLLFAPLVGRRRALWLSVAAVCAYAALIGASPPVLRATIMGILLVAASLSGRRTNGLIAITLAAAIMAGLDPPIISDVSFQLSFAATAGIMVLASPLRHALVQGAGFLLGRSELPRWTSPLVFEPAAVTVAAVVATTPLLALNFGRVSITGLPANMLVVPAFPLILAASLLAAVGGLIPHMHLVLAAPAYIALSYWLAVTAWLAALPGAALSFEGYGTGWAVASYALIAGALPVLARALRRGDAVQLAESRPFAWRRTGPLLALLAPSAALLATAGFVFWPSAPARLEVTVLDVGQGDAILVETPGGHNVLIDGGPGPAVLRGLGDELAWDDRRIDLVVLTHAQADHYTGLVDVLERFDVRRIVSNGQATDAPGVRAFLDAVHDEATSVDAVTAGASFDLGDGVRLDVLAPPAGTTLSGPNNAALVLRLSWRDVSFLLTGDIEAAGEAALLASGTDLRSTVLKVAHHGSATSSTPALLDAVRPAFAVVSAGARNPFGHPNPDVLQRLEAYGEVYVTAVAGSVHFETDGWRLRASARR